MHTLKDVKRRVRLLLDQYSENGDIIFIPDTFYADSDLKFNEVTDYIQRKICVTSKKLTGRMSLVLRNPSIAAPLNPHAEFVADSGGEVFIKVPANARTFSFKLDTETGANVKVEVYEFKKDTVNLSAYEFGIPSGLKNLNQYLDLAEEHGDKFLNIQAVQQITQVAGYLPSSESNLAVTEAFILKVTADANYPLAIADFAAYENFFSSRELIPERGYTSARLPSDIIELISVEKCIDANYGSSGVQPLDFEEMKNLIFSKEKKVLTARAEYSGVYRITYYRYPKRIAFDSHEDEEIELDDFSVDALVFGVASIICPIENAAIIARMQSMFEEMMRNLYNSEKSVKRIENKMFGGNPRGLKFSAR